MKTAIKTMIAAAACACAGPALAYTINGTIPAGKKPVLIHLHGPFKAGDLKLTLTAPPKNAGVSYALDFCIGPASNPCGLPTSLVFNVPEGQTRVEVVHAEVFQNNVFVVGQGTKVSVPFVVQVN